jgi:hypothetical protein
MLRKPAWISALWGLAAAIVVAMVEFGMPLRNLVDVITFGAAYGLFPIGWIAFSSILLYRVTLETGKFEIIKDSVSHLTEDRRMQTLRIAFAFGAFIEGAAGFGTPIAVAAPMLAELGFAPLCGRSVLVGEYRASCVRFHRHPDHYAGWRYRPAAGASERGRRTRVRAHLVDHPRVSDHGNGRVEGAEGSAPRSGGVRHRVRVSSVFDLELR